MTNAVEKAAPLFEMLGEPPFSPLQIVLWAGIHLIEHGYGRLALLPYVYATGHWRCEFHPMGKPGKPLFRYTEGNGYKFLASHCGGSVRKNISPKGLAKAIMVSVPASLKAQCEGDVSPEYARWLDGLKTTLLNGGVPVAFDEYTEDFSLWSVFSLEREVKVSSLHPPPGYIKPDQEETWADTPYWRGAIAKWDGMSKNRSSVVDFSAIESGCCVERVASELAIVLAEAPEWDRGRVLKAAMGELLHELSAKMVSPFDFWKPLSQEVIAPDDEFALEATYSEAEKARIFLGYIPKSDDDKWFIYALKNTLYFHRSSSGFLYATLELCPTDCGRWKAKRFVVSKGDEGGFVMDAQLALDLIDYHLLGKRL